MDRRERQVQEKGYPRGVQGGLSQNFKTYFRPLSKQTANFLLARRTLNHKMVISASAGNRQNVLNSRKSDFRKSRIFGEEFEKQNIQFCFSNSLPRGRKVETLNVSSFRASGIPKLGTFNVPMFGLPLVSEVYLIDVWAARGGSCVNPQYDIRTADKTTNKNWRNQKGFSPTRQ